MTGSKQVHLGQALALLIVVIIITPPPQAAAQNWRAGRATYYGAPYAFGHAYDPTRNEGSFGVLAADTFYCQCGFGQSDALPFPADSVAAAASGNPDYAGSCGRCYAVRCKSGLVLNNAKTPINITNGFYEGDEWRPYLPAINASVPDSQGRTFPGNSAEAQGEQYVQCYDESRTLVVRILDCCTCMQGQAAGAPGQYAGVMDVRPKKWCCGGVEHFDLSYWAFEKLAHPVFGVIMIEYAPVDCDTGNPVPDGYISKDFIYSGGTKPGWSWGYYHEAFQASNSMEYAVDAGAPSGKAATCVSLAPAGTLTFTCRGCDEPDLQPFAGATAISFWVKANSNSTDPSFSSTPQGQPPNLVTQLLNFDTKRFCDGQPKTGELQPKQHIGDWYHFVIPISEFKCGSWLASMTRIELHGPGWPWTPRANDRDAYFCVADLQIQH